MFFLAPSPSILSCGGEAEVKNEVYFIDGWAPWVFTGYLGLQVAYDNKELRLRKWCPMQLTKADALLGQPGGLLRDRVVSLAFPG